MKILIRAILVIAATVSLIGVNLLSNLAWSAEYPQVSQLHKFTVETDYMSLPGYLRYMTFVQNGTWLTRHEAAAIVKQQQQTASY